MKALTVEELRRLIEETPAEWRPLVELLAQTGLRVSEALALRWVDLDLGRRRVRVRRRLYRGAFGPPKTKHGRRDVPVSPLLAQALWERRKAAKTADAALVFAAANGEPIDYSRVFRVVKAAAKRAGVSWPGLHTLRHTCATLYFTRGGANPKQVQGVLGHHAASFTLDTYIHLLPDALPSADFLDVVLAGGPPGGHTTRRERPRSGRQSGDRISLFPVGISFGLVASGCRANLKSAVPHGGVRVRLPPPASD